MKYKNNPRYYNNNSNQGNMNSQNYNQGYNDGYDQQQQQPYPVSSDVTYLSNPIIKQLDSEFLKIQVTYDDVIEKIEHTLKNEVENEHGNWVEVRTPIFTEAGIYTIMKKMKMWMTRDFILGNYDDETARKLVIAFADNLGDELLSRFNLYFNKDEDVDLTELSNVIHELSCHVFANLSRGLNGWTAKLNQNIQQVQETHQYLPQEKRGFFSRLGGRMKF